jgi:putative nucleotidyltransferase with HDIG domain
VIVAVAFRPNPRFSEERRQLLHILTSRGEAALENVRLHEGLKATLRQTIQGLVNILEAKDPYTRGHSERVKLYAGLIAEGLELPPEDVTRIEEAALVHDIGKICIRQEELNKPGPLSPAEYEMFKSHTTRGKWLLEPIAFLQPLIPSVYHHHERWDGRGYPLGLAGEAIPHDARIMAVADSYDAMTSNRPYRRALSHEVAVEEIRAQAGRQFDPEIADIFIREIQKLKATQRERRERWVDILEARSKRAHIPGYTDGQRSAKVSASAGDAESDASAHRGDHEPATQ